MNILITGDPGDRWIPFLSTLDKSLRVVQDDSALRQAVQETEGPLAVVLGSGIPVGQMKAICLDLRVRFASQYPALVCLIEEDLQQVAPGLLVGGADHVLSADCTELELNAVLTAVRRQARFQWKLQTTCRELRVQATTDGLTGLRNRAEVLRILDRELNRMHRHETSLSVLMLDVDHFKQINDRYGHLAGDEVLRSIGDRLQRSVRSYDEIGRYGGEEFIAILPETDLNQALIAAERIRNDVIATSVRHQDQDLKVTVSIGVVSSCGVNDTAEQLIERADLALYAAKQSGRNCVCGFPNEMPTVPPVLITP